MEFKVDKETTSIRLSHSLMYLNNSINFIEDIWLNPVGLSDKDLDLIKSAWRRMVNVHKHLSPVLERMNNDCN